MPDRTLTMVTPWLYMPYLVCVLAFRSPPFMQKLNGFDYSYGIYIYAFPIQQAVSQIGAQHEWRWAAVFVTSTLVTAAAAALSWYLVEKPALSLKRYIAAKRAPVKITATEKST